MTQGKYFDVTYDNVRRAMTGLPPIGGELWVQDFEKRFAESVEASYAVATNSGTSAIHAGLKALGVSPGDEVISPALTVVMDSYATLALGASPVFADVDPDTWILDAADVEAKISAKTKAIIVVSWFGLPVDMRPFRRLHQKYGIPVLDDSAETLFVRDVEGKFSGTNADVGIFSFEEKKHLTTGGEGGMLVTESADIAEAARKFAGIGYRHLSATSGRTSLDASVFQNPSYQRFDAFGLNYRMTPVTAAIGLGQLEHREEIINTRMENAKYFLDAVQNYSWMIPQQVPVGTEHAYYTVGVRYAGEFEGGPTWKVVHERFREEGGDGFYANCLCPFMEPVFLNDPSLARFAEQGRKECPVALRLQGEIMAFKTHYRDSREAERQAHILFDVLGELS